MSNNEKERKELSLHIGLLQDLEKKASCNLCDSGTGSCTVHRACVAAIPAINLCVRMLKKHQRSLAKI